MNQIIGEKNIWTT